MLGRAASKRPVCPAPRACTTLARFYPPSADVRCSSQGSARGTHGHRMAAGSQCQLLNSLLNLGHISHVRHCSAPASCRVPHPCLHVLTAADLQGKSIACNLQMTQNAVVKSMSPQYSNPFTSSHSLSSRFSIASLLPTSLSHPAQFPPTSSP